MATPPDVRLDKSAQLPEPPPDARPNQHSDLRPLWFIIFGLISFIVGGTTGTLCWMGGTSVPYSILAGGAAVAGTVTLLLKLYKFLSA